MHGPEDGRLHDTTLYRKSDMNHHFSQSLTINGDPLGSSESMAMALTYCGHGYKLGLVR
jgi:hypothetical protein